MNNRLEHLQRVKQMPRIRVKNINKQYKVAARFFNPDKLDQEEEPTHVKFKRKQLEIAAKTRSGFNTM